ncbi:MAG: uroporphyrinogen-III synthase [Arachnia sp.]
MTDLHPGDQEAVGGSVTFVGAGPGDLELIALAGARAIGRSDVVVVEPGVSAADLAAAGIECDAELVTVAEDEAAQLIDEVSRGRRVVRLAGSSCSAETFHETALPAVLEQHRIGTRLIPAVSRAGCALVYSAVAPTRSVANFDASEGISDDEPWPMAGTVVVWTNAEHLAAVAARGAEELGGESEVLLLTGLGTSAQQTKPETWASAAAAIVEGECYLITGPGIDHLERQQLDWFTSKPLFDWNVLLPRTKDDLDYLASELARYGAAAEIVPTMAIEPPRTEQPMEKAMRGIIDGRFGWLVFTSPVTVDAVIERLASLGLDSRALSGVQVAATGRGTIEALAAHGLRPDFTPSPPAGPAELAGEFPAYDDLLDPIGRVLLPTADVAVADLMTALTRLGWEPEEVAAYRTVRAAPPPAEVRERIKSGMFDAVAFTSSTAVRNLIGIAGKPHAASVIVAIGQATARTCEMHGLRVDAVAPTPTSDAVAGALARFAEQRRAERVEQGLPDTKPSQRRRRRRRVSA